MRESYDQWLSDHDRGDDPVGKAPEAVTPHVVPGVETDYRGTASWQPSSLGDAPTNLVVQQVSAACPLAVVPDDCGLELLQRLWMELEKHHFRVRDFLMWASTSSQGIVLASPLSIWAIRFRISLVQSGCSSIVSGSRLSLNASTNASRSFSGRAKASSRIFLVAEVTSLVYAAGCHFSTRAKSRRGRGVR